MGVVRRVGQDGGALHDWGEGGGGCSSTVSGLIRLVISLECFIEITPDFLCPFMND